MRASELILHEIDHKGDARSKLATELGLVDRELGELLIEAKAHPEISVTLAAHWAKIERPVAYRLMAKVKGSES